jgi:hypothetical protein
MTWRIECRDSDAQEKKSKKILSSKIRKPRVDLTLEAVVFHREGIKDSRSAINMLEIPSHGVPGHKAWWVDHRRSFGLG